MGLQIISFSNMFAISDHDLAPLLALTSATLFIVIQSSVKS